MKTDQKAIVCTVALGSKYTDMASPLLNSLAREGNRCLVLTDSPQAFSSGVEILAPPDKTHPWHQKRHVLRLGLEKTKTVYWLEADSRPLSAKLPIARLLPPGIHTGQTQNLHGQRSAWRASDRLPVYLQACELLNINEDKDRAKIKFVDDTAYAISRDSDGLWKKMFQLWDVYATWLLKTSQLTNDGVALGLCSHVTGFPIHVASSDTNLTLDCQHLASGNWRRELDCTTELP